MSLETCWTVKEQWNNKLSYTVHLVGHFYKIFKPHELIRRQNTSNVTKIREYI